MTGEPPALRIAVNTLCSTVGGGRTHLLKVLPRIFEMGRRHAFTVFVAREDLADFRTLGAPNVTWEVVGFRGVDAARRLIWENVVLPFRLLASRQDVVFAPANLTHFAGGVPRVIVVHNVLPFYPELWSVESFRSRMRLRLLARATRYFIGRAQATVFLSRTGRADALRGTHVVPREEAVVYHGVDPGFGGGDREAARRAVRERWGVRGPYALYASHLYRYKKVESPIRALARMTSGPAGSLELVVAGTPFDADYARSLRDEAERLGVAGRVHFLGSVEHDALSLLHAGAAVVVFLSACENCPNLVLEAMASGRPLIVSDRSVMPELVGDAALLVDPDRVDDVAAAVERALTDERLAEQLGARGRARAGEFTWQRSAEGILRLLEHVGHGTKRSPSRSA
ncbi:MAG TPA: glycosyltransferase family 1 protein [Candidatus Polarisedimenticolaceae bacterium]